MNFARQHELLRMPGIVVSKRPRQGEGHVKSNEDT